MENTEVEVHLIEDNNNDAEMTFRALRKHNMANHLITKIKILHLEDAPVDAELVARVLKKGGVEAQILVVDNKIDFEKALAEYAPDIVLSDHSMPDFNSTAAIKIMKLSGLKIPFILITATVSEEFAVATMKAGADDYILKASLTRLPSAVANVMEKYTTLREKEKAEREIAKSEKRFRELFEAAPEGITVVDVNTLKFVLFNENAVKLLKYPETEFSKIGLLDISPLFQPDGGSSHEMFQEVIDKVMQGGYPAFEWIVLDADGKEIPCELKLSLLSNLEKPQILASIVDITERKKAQQEIIQLNNSLELKVKERTAQLQEINNDLESFNYSVSHDLRSPLQVINGYVSILSKKYETALDVRAHTLLDGIGNYTKQMSLIMESLLNLSQLGRASVKRKTVEVAEIVNTVIKELEFVNKSSGVEIIVGNIPDARCDAGLVKQVWINLLSNAIKYSKQKDKPAVEIGSYETDHEVIYFVKDNGAGFDMKSADKLFSAFQRLHSSSDYEGVGIGLTIVHRIITKHEGRIWAEGKEGEGATFYFTLNPKERIYYGMN